MIENHVVSLESAKKLKELGVKQESYFYWIMHDGIGEPECSGDIFVGDFERKNYDIELCSAFLVSELGLLLPKWFSSIKGDDNRWGMVTQSPPPKIGYLSDKEADCRAKILIHLIENKLIEVKNDN